MLPLFALLFLLAQAPGDAVTYIPAKDVAAAQEKTPAPIAKGEKYSVLSVKRVKAGESEIHALDLDVFYIVDGSATFTTGGTVVGGKTTAPNEIRGTSIKGGKVRKLSKGDVLVIPAGTPHWFTEVQGSVTYFIVKVATKP